MIEDRGLDMEENRSPEILKEKCPECQSTNIIRDYEQGEIVCGDCGYVLQEREVNREAGWRAFDRPEYERKVHAETDRGLPTRIGPHYNAKGRVIPSSFQTRRLKKWQSWSVETKSSDRNLLIATPELDRLSEVLAIPRVVKEEAMMVYRRALKKGLVRGRSIDTLVAAALYAACRKFQIAKGLSEISKKSKTDKKEVARNYRLLIRRLNLRQPITNNSIYIIKVAGNLGLSLATQEKAFSVIKKAQEKGLTAGKNPKTLAAAALYIACTLNNEKRTQKEIADEALITEVSVRNRYQELKTRLGFSLKSS